MRPLRLLTKLLTKRTMTKIILPRLGLLRDGLRSLGFREGLVTGHRELRRAPKVPLEVQLIDGGNHVPGRRVELALQVIDLRLEFSDSSLQSSVFDDPRVRELGALQERQRQ